MMGMSDIFSKEKRSEVMSKIRGKDTKLEIKVRKWLHAQGIRYRKNVRTIMGTPDIAIRKYKVCVFINGCFWHGHEGCPAFRLPKTHQDFWKAKIERNRQRDIEVHQQLRDEGWDVIVLWECRLNEDFENAMVSLKERIDSRKTLT
jgi:DNA mismatch endonuclease, patch repair protein